ncbi:MAG TPA: DUF2892 domain-containing protein [Pseudomonadales bacterium]|nr:DUF2892 domain-containing protein [Pseudomonadales bacterium]
MKANVGGSDKVARFVLGGLIIAVGVYYGSWWGALGLIPLITGTLSYCPAYSLLGFSSHKTPNDF